MTDKQRRHREYTREWQARWRAAAHAALGGVCCRCGFADARALQIDHVNGDGAADMGLRPARCAGGRKRSGDLGSYYRRVVQEADSGRYQLLCANCNWIKRHENGEYRKRIE